MKAKKMTLKAQVIIEYAQSERFCHITDAEAAKVALNQVFKPDFKSMENGVCLEKVEVVAPEELNPIRVFGYADSSTPIFIPMYDGEDF